MIFNTPSVKCGQRSVSTLNDPYGSNDLNRLETDRYDAGVLDNPHRIGRHEVLLPINHKNYNFREKNGQVMKERKNSH